MGQEVPAVCVYCLGSPISVSICLGCRTRLEQAEARAKGAERTAAHYRREFWKLLREKQRRLRGPQP